MCEDGGKQGNKTFNYKNEEMIPKGAQNEELSFCFLFDKLGNPINYNIFQDHLKEPEEGKSNGGSGHVYRLADQRVTEVKIKVKDKV